MYNKLFPKCHCYEKDSYIFYKENNVILFLQNDVTLWPKYNFVINEQFLLPISVKKKSDKLLLDIEIILSFGDASAIYRN